METPDPDSLSERLSLLERECRDLRRSCRRWRRGGLILGTLATLAVGAMALVARQPADVVAHTVRAQQILLVDEAGRVRGGLQNDPDGNVGLGLLDANGRNRLWVGFNANGSTGLTVADGEGQERYFTGLNSRGYIGMVAYDASRIARARFGIAGPSIGSFIRDAAGKLRVFSGQGTDGRLGLTVLSSHDSDRVTVGLEPNGDSGLHVHDSDHFSRLFTGLQNDGASGSWALDWGGITRTFTGVLSNSTSGLVAFDSGGTARVSVSHGYDSGTDQEEGVTEGKTESTGLFVYRLDGKRRAVFGIERKPEGANQYREVAEAGLCDSKGNLRLGMVAHDDERTRLFMNDGAGKRRVVLGTELYRGQIDSSLLLYDSKSLRGSFNALEGGHTGIGVMNGDGYVSLCAFRDGAQSLTFSDTRHGKPIDLYIYPDGKPSLTVDDPAAGPLLRWLRPLILRGIGLATSVKAGGMP